jgi:cytosine/adenosine deaminase-related metal-dependent hydrolase
MKTRRRLIHAAMVVDAESVAEAPGALLIDGEDAVIAAGSPQMLGEVADAEVVDLPRSVVLPALVNVHAHLDLTHLGRWERPASFLDWVRRVRSGRAMTDDEIADSVRRGIELSHLGGVAIVGDIAGAFSRVPAGVMRELGMAGVSFIEVFGNGSKERPGLDFIARLGKELDRGVGSSLEIESSPVRIGLQPHSPYSCTAAVYRAAGETRLPLATHLAETPEEIEFTRFGRGPFETLLREVGAWDDSCSPPGAHSVDLVLDAIGDERPFIAAHVNYLDEHHLDRLARSAVTVAYCPRASEYFGHPRDSQPAHRYRDMLARGIKVALGTDSIICLDTVERLSVLDDMRFLIERDGADPRTLLAMATVIGAEALGFDRDLVTLRAGRKAGIIALDLGSAERGGDPLSVALQNCNPSTWISHPASAISREGALGAVSR